MPHELEALLAEIRKSPGCSPSLDTEIECVLMGAKSVEGGFRVYKNHLYYEPPEYTSSVDAALALVERVLPEHDWIIGHTNGGLTIHAQIGPGEMHFGETPALAILTALLSAKIDEARHDI